MVYVQEVLDMMNPCAIIPTYNESKNIGKVLAEIKQYKIGVIVIDDGSTDATSEIANNQGAIVLNNEKNQGKGASLIRGFNYALSKGYDAVITMDGDGQHLPEDIPYFLRLAEYSDSQIFIGNRMNKTKNMPVVRVFTNRFMSWIISSIIGQSVPDTQCGYRLIKKKVLEKINLRTANYEIESEIIIKGARAGFKIEAVPIKTIYRDEKSKINPFVDSLRFLKFIFGELWISNR